MTEGTITITLPARDARVMIHLYGWAVDQSETSDRGHLWDIYYSMKSQSRSQRGKSE